MKYLKQEFYQILKSDEDFFDFIQLNAFDGLWFWNLEKPNDKWISPKFCNLLGYEYEELQGNHIQKIVHQDDLEKINTIFLSYKTTDSSTIYEHDIRFYHKNGTVLWLKMKALVFGNPQENNHRVVVTHTNTTKEHIKEDELLYTQQLLNTCNSNAKIGIWNLDLKTGIVQWDKIARDIHEVDENFIIHNNGIEFYQEKDKLRIEKVGRLALTEGKNPDEEFEIITYKGNKRWIRVIGVPVMENGNCIEFYGTIQDITSQKQAELKLKEKLEELENTQKELINTQQILKTCNENTRVGVWVLDLKTRLVKWDKIIREIHEVDENFIVDAKIGISFYKEKDQEKIKKNIALALEEGVSYDDEFQFITNKGSQRWVRTTGVPTMKNGVCIELYGTFQDITEKKEVEIQLKEKVAELQTTQNQLIHTQKLLDASNEAASIGTWELNLDDFSTKVDKVTRRIHEVDEDFIWNVDNAILFYKEGYSRERITKVFKRAFEEGIPYDEQLKIVTATGKEVWIRTIGIPTFENEKCVELYGTFQDITTQKQADLKIKEKVEELETTQQQLIHTQKLLDASNEAAQIGTWELNLSDYSVDWDKVTKSIHEVDTNFITTVENGIEFYTEGYSREKITSLFKKAVEEGIYFDEELKIITAKGNEIWVRVIGVPIFENGKCIELYGTTQNIDKQKRNEINLEQKLRELEVSQKQLVHTSTLLETCNASAIIGTWEYDVNTKDIVWDKIVHAIYELPHGIDLDTQAKINFFKKGKSREKVIKILKEAREEGKPFDEELELINFRGNHKWVRIIGIPQMKEGRVVDLYGTFQDITPQKSAELKLQEKVEELEFSQKEVEKIQAKLAMTLEKTGVGLWELDLTTGETLWDEQSYKLFHETKESFMPEKWQEKIYPQDLEYILKSFEEIAMNQTAIFDVKYRMNQKSGMYFYHSKGILVEEDNKRKVIGTTQDITKQKLVELELKQKVHELETAQQEVEKIQAKLSITLDKTGIGLWEIDLITNQPYWSKQTRIMFGISEHEEINAESTAQRIHHEDIVRINGMLGDLITQRISRYHAIYRTVPIDGKTHYHESKAILIKDNKGNPISVLGVTQDITQQKGHEKIIEEQNAKLAKSEQELRKGLREMYRLQKDLEIQKQQLEQIFDAVPAMIYQFKRDSQGNVSFPLVSKGSEFILGIESKDILNNSSNDIFEAIHPEDLLGFQSSVQKSSETMQKWESELRLLKNGKEVWIHATSKPIYMDDGSVLWTGIMQNIDQLKETEFKVQQQNKQLQETLNELRTTQSQLIHNEKMTTLGQLVASIAHEINTPLGAIRSSATSIERILKSSLTMLSQTVKLLSEEQLENFNLLIEKSMESNYLYSSREKRSIKYELIDSLDARGVPQSDRISDILVDIGVHQEKELYEPFVVLPNAVQILDAVYQLSTIARSNATVMIATEKASKIIITLKNFSRQDHTGEMKPTNINESLENTLVLYHNQLKYGIEVIRKMDTLPLINAYEDELAQVWTNLLHNAIQAVNTNTTKKGKIYLATQKQDDKILVLIKDTGTGIPDEVQQKIFDAFFTTKAVGEGSGLGLNIVRKIIEKHDGKIWFETQNIGENTGTTFFVELPIK